MLKNPPEVTPDLLWLSLRFEIAAILTALLAGPVIALGCFLYSAVSVFYSWDKIRLKKRPFIGWVFTGIGQGFIMFMAISISLPESGFNLSLSTLIVTAVCMSIMIMAASPLLEIFQHEQDALRGDLTISRYMGVTGTLFLSGTLLVVSFTGFIFIIFTVFGMFFITLFLLLLFPAMFFFVKLLVRVFINRFNPDYSSVMPVSFAASTGLNCFLMLLLCWKYLAA